MAGNFYSVKTLSGENYFGRINNGESFVTLTQDEGQDVIDTFNDNSEKWLILTDVFVMTQTQTGVIPVEFSKMPMGSNRVIVQVQHVTEIAVLDRASQFVKALENIKLHLMDQGTRLVRMEFWPDDE